MTLTRTALVIGATGNIGGAVASALIAAGWHVRALSRDPRKAAQAAAWLAPVEWVAGDAMRADDVIAAARGASLIVHGANPAGYRNWREFAIPMLASAIAAARTSGARLVFPGNIYNYGPDAFPVVSETSPQHPCSEKGAIRVEMEAMLRAACDTGVRAIVVRAGDFFGAHQSSSWIRNLMVRPGRPIRSVTYPGNLDVGHAWAYLPDLAETIVRLAAIEHELPAYDVYHFAGHFVPRGADFAEAIRRIGGQPEAKIKVAPWRLFRLLSPFVPLLRELLKMHYLWDVPVQLDNAKLVARIGEEPHTPLDDALTMTLRDLKCLAA